MQSVFNIFIDLQSVNKNDIVMIELVRAQIRDFVL
jgi:hypothetical protein